MLMQIKEEQKDENLLEIWDEKLAEYAIKICEYRKEFIEKIKNPNAKMHNIALGFIYVAVFGAMLAFSIYWHFFLRAEGI